MKFKKEHAKLIAGIASASMLIGCGNRDVKRWKQAPGTRGLINLNAVKTAFQKNQHIPAFEKRVNEIFEGDNLVVFKSEKHGNGFKLAGYEDLNKDKKVDSKDDLLFTLTVVDGRCTLQGHGANSYYKETWSYGQRDRRYPHRSYSYYHHSPYFFYWYGPRSTWGGSYYTPVGRYDDIASHRSSYRSKPAYRKQVKTNQSFERSMRSKHGSKFTNATKSVSSTRKNYVKRTSSKRSFSKNLSKNRSRSGWGVRTRSSSRSSSSRSRGGWGRSSGGVHI